MGLKAQLDRAEAELSDPVALEGLRSYLLEHGATRETEAAVIQTIKVAIKAARAIGASRSGYATAVNDLWSGGGSVSVLIDSAYCTLLLIRKRTPVRAASDEAAKSRCDAAIHLLEPFLTEPAGELVRRVDGLLPASGQPARPLQDWSSLTELIVPGASEHFRGSHSAEPHATEAGSVRPDVPLYEVWYGTNRLPVDADNLAKGFSNERDPEGRVYYGSCTVEVPRTHEFGSLGTAFWKRWLRLKFTDDHLRLRKIEPFATREEFLSLMREELQGLAEEERAVLVYLHGFNTSFEEAALRAAQIGFDLKSPVTAFYSWPSMAEVHRYSADIARVEASETQIAGFLQSIAESTGAAKVHVIAHSMGNRGFGRAVARIASQAAGKGVRFGQIILAAPDLDVDLFKQLAAVYPRVSDRTTMYVSARDRALEMSGFLQDSIRAGFTPPVTVLDGVDTVDVTNIDLTALGHGYFAEAQPVLYDIKELIDHNKPPGKRTRVDARSEGQTSYWVIRN